MLNELKTRLKYSKYSLYHKKAFLKVEKELLGHNTFRGYKHDLDKVILYPFLGVKLTNKLHNKYQRHHKRAHTKKDYVEKIIDWECARYTKPDKPLNAYETLMKFYPDKKSIYLPIMKRLRLI